MEKQDNIKTPKKGKKASSKQVVAICGVVLLVLMYIITLMVAILDNSDSGRWFMSCIFATVAIPLLIWIYTWMYGKITGRHTIADAPQRMDTEPVTNTDIISPENLNSSCDNK